jgi:integrase
MPSIKLTDPKVKALKEPGDHYDEQEHGLILRVRESGSKTWALRYRRDGRYRRLTIGKYPTKSLKMARKEAKATIAAIQSGKDPQGKKESARSAETPKTFKGVCEEYIERVVVKSNKKAKEKAAVYRNHVYPRFGRRSISEIHRREFKRLIEELADNKPGTAREVLKYLKVMYLWALDEEYVEQSPVATIKVPEHAKEKPRKRWLRDSEVAVVWQAWEHMDSPFREWFKVLLLTGQRRSEVAQMRWCDIDLNAAVWTIPVEDGMVNKSQREHEVPLTNEVIEILETLPHIGPFIFTTDGKTHIQNFSGFKKQCDELVTNICNDSASTHLNSWWIHDLRRTTATGLGNLKFAPHIAEIVQNRINGQLAGIVRTYNLSDYRSEKRKALEAWSRHITQVTNPDACNNVVPLTV